MTRSESTSDAAPQSYQGTRPLSLVTALAAIGTGAILTFISLVYGQSQILQQVREPLVGGGFWPIEVIALTIIIVAFAFFGGAFILGIFSSLAPPQAFGQSKYTLLGVGGVIGVFVGVLVSVANVTGSISEIYGSIPSEAGESMLALALLAIPLGFVFFQLSRPSEKPMFQTPREPEGEPGSEQVDIRKARVQINEERQYDLPEQASNYSPQHPSASSGPEPSSSLNFDELKFHWVRETDVSMDDVGGMEELKQEIERDIIRPLTTDRDRAAELGIPLPNLIFHGPPGTGKTFMAKALATEIGLPFVKLSGADVTSKYVNQTPQEINDLFREAERVANSEGGAIVFLDELDTVLKKRDDSLSRSHEEDKKAVNEFLNHLENTGDNNVVFIGATNRLDSLDEAGIRRGRIDKKIFVGKPDKQARKDIIKAQLQKRPNNLTEQHIKTFAESTAELTAADIEGIVVDAARTSAFDRNADVITWRDILGALDHAKFDTAL